MDSLFHPKLIENVSFAFDPHNTEHSAPGPAPVLSPVPWSKGRSVPDTEKSLL